MLWKKNALLSASLTPTPIPSFIPQSTKKYFFRRKNQIPVTFINFSVIMKSFLAKSRRKREVVFSELNLKEN